MNEFLQQLVNGCSLGAVYALIALGYTMVYGVLRFINFAHSDVFMVGAFAGYYLAPYFARETFVGGMAILSGSMIVCAVLGVLIERFAYRPLRSSSKLNVLITAIGVSLLLENAGQHFFGADPKAYPAIFPTRTFIIGSQAAPEVQTAEVKGEERKAGEIKEGPTPKKKKPFMLVISSNQLTVLAVSAALLMALQFIIQRTKIGVAMRAVSFNPLAASLVGINIDIVISFTFALGSALAAAGGILYATNYPAIDPLMGVVPGLKAFVAAVLGGIGNIPGAALGGLLLGIIETFVNGSHDFSTYTDAVSFAILILILLFKPAGLLGKMQVEKV